MKFKLNLKKFLFATGFNVERISATKDIIFFISQFNKNYKFTELIRVGPDGDGGYLLPDILKNISYCFSAGVGEISKFEKHLSRNFKIKSFMADASVNSPPEYDDNFIFIKKYLGSKTYGEYISLSDWLKESIGNDQKQKILQMDIEGSEYEVLTYESAETLSKFSLILVEFHGLQNLYNRNFLKMISAIFQKIYMNFSICHVHPNNASGFYGLNNIKIPSCLEVTFVRNDLLPNIKKAEKINLPHPLDQKTFHKNPEIIMPEIWWKK